MTPMTSTSKAGLTVTTSVRAIDRTGVDAANEYDRAHVPLDWRMVCDRFDAPEPLRMLDDERGGGVFAGILSALAIEAVVVFAAVKLGIWIWRMCR